MRTPYCYLIGWKDLNKWYYGVRYAKGCHPDELWKSYFTSSKHVARFSKKHGAPNIIEIRKIFNEPAKALKWEQKVLQRLNVEQRKDFLNAKNKTTNTLILETNKSSFKKGQTAWNKGKSFIEIYGKEWTKEKYSRIKTNEELQKISLKGKIRFANVELRQIYSERTKLQFQDPIKKETHRINCNGHGDKIWINDGYKNKRIYANTSFLYENWSKGRIINQETKDKMKQNRSMIKDPTTGRFIKKEYVSSK